MFCTTCERFGRGPVHFGRDGRPTYWCDKRREPLCVAGTGAAALAKYLADHPDADPVTVARIRPVLAWLLAFPVAEAQENNRALRRQLGAIASIRADMRAKTKRTRRRVVTA